LVLSLLPLGCTSALKEPPPVSVLAGGPPASADVDVGALLARADDHLARRPDIGAVTNARQLYLEAISTSAPPLEGFIGAARATAWLIEHVDDGRRREELAVEGVQIGQWCRRHHPDAPECRYHLALSVGQQAREKPSTATDGLEVMVGLLEALVAEAPEIDRAGPDRTLALVLLRAPGWPTGPGDPEFGLEHARAAVEAYPEHPPNQLVLGEALLENGLPVEARAALELGVAQAQALVEHGDADAAKWLAKGREALASLR
jgi:hypothetical protein